MEIEFEFDAGPLSITVISDNGEAIRDEVEPLVEMAEEKDLLSRQAVAATAQEGRAEDGGQDGNGAVISAETERGPIGSLASRLSLESSDLEEVIELDESGENPPLLLLGNPDILGESRAERQRNASLAILRAWDEALGEERVPTSDLKEALSRCGIADYNLSDMRKGDASRYFASKGRGSSATIALTSPGDREARRVFEHLIEEIDGEP